MGLKVTTANGSSEYITFPNASGNVSAAIGGYDDGTNKGHIEVYTNPGTGLTEVVRIDNAGNVGIGTSSPSYKLHVYQSNSSTSEVGRFYGAATYAGISTGDATTTQPNYIWALGNAQTFWTNGSERMRIDSSGNLLVGTTSQIQGGKVSVNYTNTGFACTISGNTGTGVGLDVQRTVQNGDVAYFRSTTGLAGYITITGANTCTYNSVSDVRLKENIVDAPSALAKVESLQVRSFDWKDGTGSVPYGFIAQELNEVVPEAVSHGTTNKDGSMLTPWGIDTSLLVPYLTKAIQEQQALIQEQAATIETLTQRIEALEKK